MPNWCNNILIVRGDTNQLAAFRDKLVTGGDKSFFNKFIPMPEELRKVVSPVRIVSAAAREEEIARFEAMPEKDRKYFGEQFGITAEMQAEYLHKYGADNWYDWAVKHWDTKWDTDYHIADDQPNVLKLSFDTAWAPPIAFVCEVSEMFPALHFRLLYDEPGMCFDGCLTAINGLANDLCRNGDDYGGPRYNDEKEDYEDGLSLEERFPEEE